MEPEKLLERRKREEDEYKMYLYRLQRELPHARFFLNSRKVKDEHGVWRNLSLIEGSADLIGCVCGNYVEVEVKTRKGRQSATQRLHQGAIEFAGGVYVLAWSVEGAIEKIKEKIKTWNV